MFHIGAPPAEDYSLIDSRAIAHLSLCLRVRSIKEDMYRLRQFYVRRSFLNLHERVQKALDDITPALQAEGGDIKLVWVRDATVRLRLVNLCGKCPMKNMPNLTLWDWIVSTLKNKVPDIERIE